MGVDRLTYNSDSQQFQLVDLKRKNKIYDLRNQGSGLGQAQTCCGLNRFVGYQPFPLDNWISIGNAHIAKRLNKLQSFASTQKRQHNITKMNEDISIDSKIAGSRNAHS